MTFYEKEYFDNNSEKKTSIFYRYMKFLSKKKEIQWLSLLDIGCWTWWFLHTLPLNMKISGCDISDYAISEAIKRLKEKWNADIFQYDIESSWTFPRKNQFDIITVFDIIEHLRDFRNLQIIIKNNLKKDGVLVFTTPNALSLLRFISRSNNYNGESDLTHAMLFTPYTIDFFLRRCWLSKLELSTPYSFYFQSDILTKNILLGGQIFWIYSK